MLAIWATQYAETRVTGGFATRAEKPLATDAIPEKPGIILESTGGWIENEPPLTLVTKNEQKKRSSETFPAFRMRLFDICS